MNHVPRSDREELELLPLNMPWMGHVPSGKPSLSLNIAHNLRRMR